MAEPTRHLIVFERHFVELPHGSSLADQLRALADLVDELETREGEIMNVSPSIGRTTAYVEFRLPFEEWDSQ